MKKMILLFTFLLLPFNVFAYSKYIVPGGQTVGVDVSSDGIMIIGFYKINNKYNKGNNELKIGDYITKVNDINVTNVDEMTKVIEDAYDKRSINITFKRGNSEKNTKLNLINDDGKYKTGLYVKSSIKGIGTLTYIDPETRIYGALGHEITMSENNSIVEIKQGTIFENTITGIEKSRPGYAGSKYAKFNIDNIYGDVVKNTKYGIFGNYTSFFDKENLMEIGTPLVGNAQIKTVTFDQKIDTYDIEITSLNENSQIKNITFKVSDKKLVELTGGIVQGMSGSPIIQNNKIVGVVTHVIVDNPVTGYGLFITKMLEEGEK